MDRKTFLKGLAVSAAIPCMPIASASESGRCQKSACMSDANAVRRFLSEFLLKEESSMDRPTVLKLMQERGAACCRALKFRQDLIEQSHGSVDKLVELMGTIVGPENCRRAGNQVTLVYPQTKCICGWSPQRPASPDDPYCECSATNNKTLFETVSERPVSVQVLESPRRGGTHCRFLIQLS